MEINQEVVLEHSEQNKQQGRITAGVRYRVGEVRGREVWSRVSLSGSFYKTKDSKWLALF